MYFILPLSPEPWVVPPMSPGRVHGKLIVKAGRDEQLASFQDAVREVLARWLIDHPQWDEFFPMEGVDVKLTFYLWRTMSEYKTSKDLTHSRHQADATNMQKGLEDALQGILFVNDKQVQDVRTVIVEQSPETEPGIAIEIEPFTGAVVPEYLLNEVKMAQQQAHTVSSDNEWNGPGTF